MTHERDSKQDTPMFDYAAFLPEQASLLTRLRVALHALRVLLKDPGNPTCGPLLLLCLDYGVYASFARDLRKSERGRRLLTERPSLQRKALDLPALERMPPGSLGHELARHYRDNAIEPFERTVEVQEDVHYIANRYREIHDILHVVTGYRIDRIGELELQAFVLGNLHSRTAASVILFMTGRLMRRKPPGFDVSSYASRLWAAFRRGSRAREALSFSFEQHWDRPVSSLREQLGAPR
jgi:ubiquinone biosynthesis protein COQ4